MRSPQFAAVVAALLATSNRGLVPRDDHSRRVQVQTFLEQAERYVADGAPQKARGRTKQAWTALHAVPADQLRDPVTQGLAWRLATTAYQAGDFHSSHAAWSLWISHHRWLPMNDNLLVALGNLARTKYALGDCRGAERLEEQVIEAMRTRPDDDPERLVAHANLALTRHCLSDLPGALELQEEVLRVRLATLPDDDPQLQEARAALALTRYALDDLVGAEALLTQVLAVRRKTLTEGHLDRLASLNNLAIVKHALGDLTAARALAAEALDELLHTRPDDDPDVQVAYNNLACYSLSQGKPDEALRHLLQGASSLRRHLADSPTDFAAVLGVGRRIFAGLMSLSAAADPQLRAESNAAALLLSQDLRGAERRAYGQRRKTLRGEPGHMANRPGLPPSPATIPDLAAKLHPDEVAIAIVYCSHFTPDTTRPGTAVREERLVGFVLRADGALTQHDLGPVAPVDELVRILVAAGHRALQMEPIQALTELDARVFAPLVAALPAGTKTISLAADEGLDLIPLDTVGPPPLLRLTDGYELIRPTSLIELLADSTTEVGAAPNVVTVGGVDYGPSTFRSGANTSSKRVGTEEACNFLPGTQREVEDLGPCFQAAYPDGTVTTLVGRDANKHALFEHGRTATFLHMATHGFAPSCGNPPQPADFACGWQGRTASPCPYDLSAVALAGANAPANALGERAGMVTAREILSLDLSNCYLVVLSACGTSLGVHRPGQTFASMREACHNAGARFVLSTLWPVSDEWSRELVAQFYFRLWHDRQSPQAALQGAKMYVRDLMEQRGCANYRDWAGWVLTGR